MTGLAQLFSRLKTVSKKLYKDDICFDGRRFWQTVKELANKVDSSSSGASWCQPNEKVRNVQSCTQHLVDNGGVTHFFLQQLRIPCCQECTFARVLQLALNAGQFIAASESSCPARSKEAKDLMETFGYNALRLDHIETYLSGASIKALDACINSSISRDIIEYLDDHC